MVARVLLLVLTVLCVGVGVHATRNDHQCNDTVQDAKTLKRTTSAPERRAVVERILDRCASSQQPAYVAAALLATGHRDDAVGLMRSLTRRAPDDYVAWFGLSRLTPDAALAREAQRRAHALNPRLVPAVR